MATIGADPGKGRMVWMAVVDMEGWMAAARHLAVLALLAVLSLVGRMVMVKAAALVLVLAWGSNKEAAVLAVVRAAVGKVVTEAAGDWGRTRFGTKGAAEALAKG